MAQETSAGLAGVECSVSPVPRTSDDSGLKDGGTSEILCTRHSPPVTAVYASAIV